MLVTELVIERSLHGTIIINSSIHGKYKHGVFATLAYDNDVTIHGSGSSLSTNTSSIEIQIKKPLFLFNAIMGVQ